MHFISLVIFSDFRNYGRLWPSVVGGCVNGVMWFYNVFFLLKFHEHIFAYHLHSCDMTDAKYAFYLNIYQTIFCKKFGGI